MKPLHNVYTEQKAWELSREVSLMHKQELSKELIKKPMGSSSAYYGLMAKVGLLLDRPDFIHDKSIDWKPAIQYAIKHSLPLSKYILSLT